ncbi:MAG: SDR family oxidoreductase [Caulobacterales bacterium]
MSNPNNEFAGKIAVVTGAGAGFGAAFCMRLASAGASVAALDIDEAAAQQTADAITKAGGKAIAAACDVGDDDGVISTIGQIAEKLGGVDILINNAGLHSAEYNIGFVQLGVARSRRLFDVNIMGVINCTLACRPFMAARGGGAILNISSISGYGSGNGYGVSKLAVRGLTIAFSGEFAKDGIRVNAIAPGLIATDKIRADFPPEFFDHFITMQHVKRTGEVQDIVEAMMFLCSDRGGFITGETLKVAGGTTLQI